MCEKKEETVLEIAEQIIEENIEAFLELAK